MTRRRIYIDSSAYIAGALGDAAKVRYWSKNGSEVFVSSVLLVVEAERTFARLSRESHLAPHLFGQAMTQLRQNVETFLLRDFSLDLCLTSEFPPVRLPRSNDLVHLRTALWFRRSGGLDGFLSLDEHQRGAAAELGLPLVELS